MDLGRLETRIQTWGVGGFGRTGSDRAGAGVDECDDADAAAVVGERDVLHLASDFREVPGAVKARVVRVERLQGVELWDVGTGFDRRSEALDEDVAESVPAAGRRDGSFGRAVEIAEFHLPEPVVTEGQDEHGNVLVRLVDLVDLEAGLG